MGFWLVPGTWSRTRLPLVALGGRQGVQLAELGMQSWQERRWLDVPPLA